jgi:serine/threonine-protein kinase ATR
MAMESLQNLKQRLRGEGKKRRGMPLSVEGQVQELLRDAADIKKLETMYIGWAPYL